MTPEIIDGQESVTPVRPVGVLFATRWYPAFDSPGRGSFVADQARALTEAGVNVTVASWEIAIRRGTYAAIDGPTPEPWLRALAVDAALPSVTPRSWGAAVPVVRLPAITARLDGAPADPLAAAAREAETLIAVGTALAARQPIDLVHAHTGLPDGIAAMALADRLGVPLVVTEHDSTVTGRLDSEQVRAAYRRLAADGRQLLAVSDTLRLRLEETLGTASLPIRVVPNMVDLDAFVAAGRGARDPDELLWVGARKASKGTDVLLRAFGLVRATRPSLRLRLIGGAPGQAEEDRLVALARDLGLADAVSFEPATDRAGVAAAMARAAVFVHPSPFETFGIVAAEALAAGLPVAATPSGGVEEIVGSDGRYGEIATGSNAAALALAVERVLDRWTTFDPAVLHARVADRYASAAVAETLVATYRGLIQSSGSEAPRETPSRVTGTDAAGDLPGPDHDVARAFADASPVLVVGLRRTSAQARIAALPDDLARGLLVVTSVAIRADAPQDDPGLAVLRDVDPERAYREARARLGGPLTPRPQPTRTLRAVRHPIRAVRLRRLASRRGAMAVQATRQAIRDAVAAIARDDVPTLVLPLDADDLDLCLPLFDERIRPYGSTLRGLADRWDAAGRPGLAPPVAVAATGGRLEDDPAPNRRTP
jgi:glycosyltransferase involved in cell wall biosynthesis